ncbi:MAG: HEPN domain-containing protein [Candidatus Aenigmatarchaeota archaeon]
MKKVSFLSKVRKEGKLKLVEPSEEIKDSYLKKSESYLYSAKLLFNNNRLEESISLAYYSMYYSLLALLFKVGIKSENHTASIILLKKLFGIDNRKIIRAKKERIDKQYYVSFSLAREDVEKLIRDAEVFNSKMFDVIEKLRKEDVIKLREKFKLMVK